MAAAMAAIRGGGGAMAATIANRDGREAVAAAMAMALGGRRRRKRVRVGGSVGRWRRWRWRRRGDGGDDGGGDGGSEAEAAEWRWSLRRRCGMFCVRGRSVTTDDSSTSLKAGPAVR